MHAYNMQLKVEISVQVEVSKKSYWLSLAELQFQGTLSGTWKRKLNTKVTKQGHNEGFILHPP